MDIMEESVIESENIIHRLVTEEALKLLTESLSSTEFLCLTQILKSLATNANYIDLASSDDEGNNECVRTECIARQSEHHTEYVKCIVALLEHGLSSATLTALPQQHFPPCHCTWDTATNTRLSALPQFLASALEVPPHVASADVHQLPNETEMAATDVVSTTSSNNATELSYHKDAALTKPSEIEIKYTNNNGGDTNTVGIILTANCAPEATEEYVKQQQLRSERCTTPDSESSSAYGSINEGNTDDDDDISFTTPEQIREVFIAG